MEAGKFPQDLVATKMAKPLAAGSVEDRRQVLATFTSTGFRTAVMTNFQEQQALDTLDRESKRPGQKQQAEGNLIYHGSFKRGKFNNKGRGYRTSFNSLLRNHDAERSNPQGNQYGAGPG